MKTSVMLLLLVLAAWAVLADKPGKEQLKRSKDISKWCWSQVKHENTMTRPVKSYVTQACLKLVRDVVMPNEEEGCTRLGYLMNQQNQYDSLSTYALAASLVYDRFCTDSANAMPPIAPTNPIPTTPMSPIFEPEPDQREQQQCGESEALKKKVRHLLRIAQKRILGGTEVNDCSTIPWQVRLEIHAFLCGGSIISDRHILTASHCLEKAEKLGDVKVVLAEYHMTQNTVHHLEVPIRNMTRHHNFEASNFVSDIAVLTLKDPIAFNTPCLEIICRDPNFNFDGKSCFVSGWGAQGETGRASPLLRVVKLQANHGNNCERVFGIKESDYVYNKEQMICAGHVTGGKDTCHGDSGSPLVCLDAHTNKFVQIGVVSYGIGCGEKGHPGVYSNVVYFHEWINKIMAENSY